MPRPGEYQQLYADLEALHRSFGQEIRVRFPGNQAVAERIDQERIACQLDQRRPIELSPEVADARSFVPLYLTRPSDGLGHMILAVELYQDLERRRPRNLPRQITAPSPGILEEDLGETSMGTIVAPGGREAAPFLAHILDPGAAFGLETGALDRAPLPAIHPFLRYVTAHEIQLNFLSPEECRAICGALPEVRHNPEGTISENELRSL